MITPAPPALRRDYDITLLTLGKRPSRFWFVDTFFDGEAWKLEMLLLSGYLSAASREADD